MSFLSNYERELKRLREEKANREAKLNSNQKSAVGSFLERYDAELEKIQDRERDTILQTKRRAILGGKDRDAEEAARDEFIGPMPAEGFDSTPKRFDIAPLVDGYTSPYMMSNRDTITAGVADRINSVLLTGQTGTTLTYDDIVAQRDAATDAGERLELTSLANKKILYDNAQILAGAMMDGTNHSVLEEMYLIAEMENGKEKRERNQEKFRIRLSV